MVEKSEMLAVGTLVMHNSRVGIVIRAVPKKATYNLVYLQDREVEVEGVHNAQKNTVKSIIPSLKAVDVPMSEVTELS